ncbi:MAG: outer membrane protein transport protein [Ideonella sp.]|nr:outer membrane protein transport protein [Ideonella sp.]MCC7457596.1 outer membrane protein transport protein [Nitrospira sp.]
MRSVRTAIRALPLAGACLAFGPALATNGYFPHGYGMKAKGMAGVSTALAQDSLGGATNPAGMVFAGSRLDVGADLFMPRRDAERSGAGLPTLNGKVESDKTSFFVPEFGYNHMLRSDLSLGVTVYGNGGMNTTYPQGNFNCGAGAANMLCGSGTLGVDLAQLIVAPTVAYKLTEQHAVGLALLLGYQRFKAEGLQAFDNAPGFPPFTGSPGSVTNNGYDSSTGIGVRLGYQGRLSERFSIGATYAPKMNMGRFDKYKGLFVDSGDFDIPEHYSVGVAFMPTPAWTIAIDYGRINYSGVHSVGNPSSNQAPLGAANGPGFGWKDIDVLKIGVAWRVSEAWTVRAGYNRGDNPVRSADITFNILAPGVMKDHYTAGFTVALDKTSELTGALMLARRQSVTGASMFNAIMGPGAGGNETVSMRQSQIGLAWGRRF